MGVPLFLPSRDTLALFVNQDYTTCSDFDGYRPGYDPNSSHPYSPFASSDWHAMSYWCSYTDYYRFPHLSYFSSVPELVRNMAQTDLRKQSQLMQSAHLEHLGWAATFWKDALAEVAVASGAGMQHSAEDAQHTSSS